MRSLLVVAIVAVVAVTAVKVPTPAGERPAECVHRIPSGSHVYRNKDGSDHLVHPDGTKHDKAPCHEYGKVGEKASQQQRAQQPQTVKAVAASTPKEEVEENKKKYDGVVGYSGWTTYTKWFFPDGVGKFLGYWNVPKKPVNGSYPNPLYTFTALQNIDWVPIGSGNASSNPSNEPSTRPFDIIQPVMEYEAKSSQYPVNEWSISSWIVSLNGGNTYFTPAINVPVGSEVFGNMTKTGNRSWFINSVRMSDGANTTLVLHHNADPDDRLNKQAWAYTAVECYGCTGCSTYPADELKYYNMQLWDLEGKAITPQWEDKVEKSIHWCNEGVKTQNPSEVTYNFQKKN